MLDQMFIICVGLDFPEKAKALTNECLLLWHMCPFLEVAVNGGLVESQGHEHPIEYNEGTP